DLSYFVKTKKCIVQINPATDEENEGRNCFGQWIVLGLAFLIAGGYLQPLAELDLDQNSYKKLVSSRHKFVQRRKKVALLMAIINTIEPTPEVLREIERR